MISNVLTVAICLSSRVQLTLLLCTFNNGHQTARMLGAILRAHSCMSCRNSMLRAYMISFA